MTLKGGRQLNARLKAIGQTEGFLRLVQLDTIAGGKARVHRRTGFLARAIVPGPVSDDSASIHVNAPYAAAEELGRGPITIRPKRARMLAWPAGETRLSGRPRTKAGKPVGPMIFAKVVHQGARKPHPYLIPAALDAMRKRGIKFIVKRWNDAA